MPDDASVSPGACPKCGNALAAGKSSAPAEKPSVDPKSEKSGLCAICQSPVSPGEAKTACPACGAEYHTECWEENGGCAIYGCAQVPQVEQRRSVEIPVSFWGQEKKPCPACGREILAAAVRCRHCGATFASSKPEDTQAFQARSALEQRLPRARQLVLWQFILSILPCTAPVGGVWGLFWHSSHREELAALPPLYGALSKIGIVVGLGQSLLVVAMAILYGVLHAR